MSTQGGSKIEARRIAPGLVRTLLVGHATPDLLQTIIDAVETEIQKGQRPAVFHDWEGMTGYDSKARVSMTQWYAKVRKQVTGVHVLTKSRLVAMGVQVVALAVGEDIKIYTSRTEFEEAYQRALARKR